MRMLAAVSRKGHDTPVLEEVELGALRDGEILVRIAACGICRTDLDAHAGLARTPKPIVLGHEGAGIVEKTGANVANIAPGDHVVLAASACGHCRNCRGGHPAYCDDAMRLNFGGLRADGSTCLSANGARLFGHFFGQSSFAQYALAEAANAVKVPADIALATIAPLGCAFAAGAGAVLNALAAAPGNSIAIFGTGAAGLSAIMAARIAGADRIIAVDRVRSRLDLALELGATDAIDAAQAEIVPALNKISPRGVDLTLNTTNSAGIFSAALECLSMGGVAGFLAAPEDSVMLSAKSMLRGGRTLKAILGGDILPARDIPRLIAHYRSGMFPLERLITVYPFSEMERAFGDLKTARVIKPVLVM